MTDLETFLAECDPDNGGDYSHDDVAKLLAMVRLQQEVLDCINQEYPTTKDLQLKIQYTNSNLNKIARGEK